MSDPPSRRRVALVALVVLLVVQPTASTTRVGADVGSEGGDVGTAFGAAINRRPSSAGATADALGAVGVDAVHARGRRGEGVDVGVIGRGFDADDDALEAHVAAHRRVGEPTRNTAHDTAVAAVVAETAPAADVYLVGVGPTPTPAEYATAVEWLTARGVDVVVDSGSYFPSVAADERRITAAAERAVDRGVVFVTSAGNYANRHWAGNGTANGWVPFADGDEANALGGGDPVRGRVTVRLRWRSTVDYDLYLYRHLPDAPDRVVAKSVGEETGPGLTVEGVDVAVPRGRYYVAVHGDGSAAAADPGRVQVFAARHRLEHATARGSMVAPATAEDVVAVGASADGGLRTYSSLSAAGTVDLTAPARARVPDAPALTGTSAAAPYVAGAAALLVSGEDDPSPARVESILERTADGEADTLDALAAVEAASGSNRTATGTVGNVTQSDGNSTSGGEPSSGGEQADDGRSRAGEERSSGSEDSSRRADGADGEADGATRRAAAADDEAGTATGRTGRDGARP